MVPDQHHHRPAPGRHPVAGCPARSTWSRVPIGIDVHTGQAFCFDPFQAYQRGIVTDPVMLVLGSKGSGKSTLVKSLAVRMAAYGYLIRHIDPKGEAGPLADYFGIDPIRPGDAVDQSLRRARPDRSGPDGRSLSPRPPSTGRSRRSNRPPSPPPPATELALTLEILTERLAQPDQLLTPIAHRRPGRAGPGRRPPHPRPARRLGTMMFGESTVTVDATAPYLSVDLSGHDDDTLRVLMVAVTGWITGLWEGTDRLRPKVVVMDEFWRLLTDRATAEWAKHAFKMAREHGTSYIGVLQHLGDLRSVDADTRNLAMGLLADSETRIVYRQPPDQAAALAELLGLTAEETDAGAAAHPGSGAVEGRRPIVRGRTRPHRHRTADRRHQPGDGRTPMNPHASTRPARDRSSSGCSSPLSRDRAGVGERRPGRIDPRRRPPGRRRRCRRDAPCVPRRRHGLDAGHPVRPVWAAIRRRGRSRSIPPGRGGAGRSGRPDGVPMGRHR